uniref:Uncharacterized protein n=1 Tax=Leersia perrieri TaxID=77586 RepID=A0A0D9WCB0_9ORYZ
MEAAAALTTTTRTTQYGSSCICSCFAPCAAHGRRRKSTVAVNLGKARGFPARRLRALPPELSEFLNPKLVPGSPSDTGDVSSLIPIRQVNFAVMLLFYFVSNWVVPAFVMKGLEDPKKPEEEEEAAPAASMSIADGQPDTKIKVKVKKTKKKKKAAVKV